MRLDDRFDDLVASLGGFYRTWYVFVGLELGLLERLRAAGAAGLTAEELADADGTEPRARPALGVGRRRARPRGARRRPDRAPRGRRGRPARRRPARVPRRPVPPRGHRQPRLRAACPRSSAAATPLPTRPDRYRVAIERLTVQDIAVFFQEVLAAVPQLVVDLQPGAPDPRRPLRRRPLADRDGPALPGHDAGRRRVRARLGRRARGPTSRPPSSPTGSRSSRATSRPSATRASSTLAYFQYALHQLADPRRRRFASAWGAVRPGGWLVALDWYLPTDPDELRTRHGELIAGVQLDELSRARGW